MSYTYCKFMPAADSVHQVPGDGTMYICVSMHMCVHVHMCVFVTLHSGWAGGISVLKHEKLNCEPSWLAKEKIESGKGGS